MSGRRAAVILAAGKGTRLRSQLPKVLHEVAGKPLLAWVIETARGAGCDPVLVVVGHGAEAVRERFADQRLTWVEQRQQHGTGHALAQAETALAAQAEADDGPDGGPGGTLLVLSGDAPVLTAATLERLAEAAESAGCWGAMACATLAEPGSLGRVLAGGGDSGDARLDRIVEAADAGADELAVRRVNAGFYALPAAEIFDRLRALAPANAQGELYLTDAVSAAAADGARVALVDLADASEALGVNSRADLARVHRRLLDRKLEALMTAGVTVLEPARTAIEESVRVGRDTVIHPGVSLSGHTKVGEGCTLGQGAWLHDCTLADGVRVGPYCVLQGQDIPAGTQLPAGTRT